MARVLVAAALALLIGTPTAQAAPQALLDQVKQVFAGMQIISQVVSLTGDAENGAPVAAGGVGAAVSPPLSQSGINAANIIADQTGTLRSADQTLSGQQTLANVLNLAAGVAVPGLAQTGFNIADVMTGTTLTDVAQYMQSTAVQEIANTATSAGALGTVVQAGINAANLAFATESIGSGTQELTAGAVQKVVNTASLGGGGSAASIDQSGVNVGNMMIADSIDNVTRVFAGAQIIDNVVNFGDGPMPATIHQSGINIANYVSANEIGTLNQISVGTQVTTNTVVDGTLQAYTQNPNGVLTQQSNANYVNVVVLKGVIKDGQTTTISQNAQFNQYNSGGPADQAGNVISISR